MKFARSVEGVVFEVVEIPDGADIADRFPPELGFRPAAPEVVAGWRADGSRFLPPAPPPPPTAAELAAHAAAQRWARQTGGISVAGLAVRTDDRTRTEIALARADAAVTPGWSTDWKLADGSFMSIGAEQIAAIAAAVSAHLRDCFAREKQAHAGIAAGRITTLAGIDEVFA